MKGEKPNSNVILSINFASEFHSLEQHKNCTIFQRWRIDLIFVLCILNKCTKSKSIVSKYKGYASLLFINEKIANFCIIEIFPHLTKQTIFQFQTRVFPQNHKAQSITRSSWSSLSDQLLTRQNLLVDINSFRPVSINLVINLKLNSRIASARENPPA